MAYSGTDEEKEQEHLSLMQRTAMMGMGWKKQSELTDELFKKQDEWKPGDKKPLDAVLQGE